MSDYWVEFISLDGDENQASDLVDAQINWILGQEIIAPSAKPDRFYGTFRDGPRFADAMDPEWVEPGAVAEDRYILFGVRIKKGWQISHNSAASNDPRPSMRTSAVRPKRSGCTHTRLVRIAGRTDRVAFGQARQENLISVAGVTEDVTTRWPVDLSPELGD